MAIAITASPGLWTGTTPLTPSKTINNGDTAIVTVVMTPTTAAVSSITGGGTWFQRSSKIQGTCKVEQWSTNVGAAVSASSISIALSGSPTAAGSVLETATGVVALGITGTAGGTSSNPSIAVVTQDANNFILAGYGWIETPTLATTAGTGTLTGSDSDGAALSDAGSYNTAASPGSVTNSVTHGAPSAAWAICALELRSVAGGATLPPQPLGRVGSYMGSRMGLR
jgi:hypothetical protein